MANHGYPQHAVFYLGALVEGIRGYTMYLRTMRRYHHVHIHYIPTGLWPYVCRVYVAMLDT